MNSQQWINRHVILVHSLAIALGAVLVSVGAALVGRHDTWANVFLALGTTVSATVGISLLAWLFGLGGLGMPLGADSKPRAFGLVDIHLHVGDERFYEHLGSATSVDLFYNTGRSIFGRYMNHIEDAIRERSCKIRVMISDPNGCAVKDDETREALCPQTNIAAEIDDVTQWLESLGKRLRAGGVKGGSIEGRFVGSPPPCSIAIVDNHVLRFTPYLPHMHSAQVPAFDIENRPGGLFAHYKSAFERVWARSGNSVFLKEDFSRARRLEKTG